MHDSADSMSTSSRRSSFDGDTPDKTLVVVINRRNKGITLKIDKFLRFFYLYQKCIFEK